LPPPHLPPPHLPPPHLPAAHTLTGLSCDLASSQAELMEAVLQRPRAVAELDLDALRHTLPENQQGRLATLIDIGFELVEPFGELREEVGRLGLGLLEPASPALPVHLACALLPALLCGIWHMETGAATGTPCKQNGDHMRICANSDIV
jgi:hypothetical protein